MARLQQNQQQETLAIRDQTESIVKRLLDLVVLYTLNTGPQTGYSIKKQLSKMFSVNVSFGTLYPHLHDLERLGYIEGAWVPHAKSDAMQKKEYVITESGKDYLKANVQVLVKISLVMQFVLAGVSLGTPTPRGFDSALDVCSQAFRREGYSVSVKDFVRGYSGAEHPVDILAEKEIVDEAGGVTKNQRILVEICASERGGAEIEDFIKVHLKAYDLGADKAIILSAPEVTDKESLKLGELYRINVFGGKTPMDAVNSMWSHKEAWLSSSTVPLVSKVSRS